MVKANWDTEELIENWTLLPTELELVSKKVGANQIGFAVLLKYFQAFVRFPDSPAEISEDIPKRLIFTKLPESGKLMISQH